jgi:hypothetical protein
MPLVRTGAEHFVLLDPGDYELNNLNRQDATLSEIGVNKARATRRRILAVNPFAEVGVFEDGVSPQTIRSRLEPGDVVVDAVDVTSDEGVRAKFALHDAACELHLKVLTAYDISPTQFVELFNYSSINKPLRGRVSEPLTSDRVLRALIPARALPRGIFAELRVRKDDPARGFPQLAMSSTLFGAAATACLLRAVNGEPIKRRIRLDLYEETRPLVSRILTRLRRDIELMSLWWRMR